MLFVVVVGNFNGNGKNGVIHEVLDTPPMSSQNPFWPPILALDSLHPLLLHSTHVQR